MSVLAHGIGGRSDLPIPVWLAMYAGAMAVLISFFAVAAFWPSSRLSGDAPGRELPAALQRIADAGAMRLALRVLGVAALAVFLGAAWFGSTNSARNPAPTWFYVWFWVGLVPASILLGPVWRLVNPLRTLAALILTPRHGRPLLGTRTETHADVATGAQADATTGAPAGVAGDGAAGAAGGPEGADAVLRRVGYWPAVVGLFAFVWLELVWLAPDSPRTVALFVTGYALVNVAAGVALGPGWFDRGDGFEAYSTLLARLSPFGRRATDGRLVLRNPLDGLAGLVPAPGLVALVVVVLGSTAFDGLSRTQPWIRVASGAGDAEYLVLGTLGLLVGIAGVTVIFLGAMALSGPELRPSAFVHTLVPIAIGYTTAHYFSLVVFQGQAGLLLAGDPFGRGWDLFGTAGDTIDYLVVSTSLIALVQVGAIIAGHIVGVVAAHDRAVALLPRRRARSGQYPLLVAMVLYTSIGIGLLVGT